MPRFAILFITMRVKLINYAFGATSHRVVRTKVFQWLIEKSGRRGDSSDAHGK